MSSRTVRSSPSRSVASVWESANTTFCTEYHTEGNRGAKATGGLPVPPRCTSSSRSGEAISMSSRVSSQGHTEHQQSSVSNLWISSTSAVQCSKPRTMAIPESLSPARSWQSTTPPAATATCRRKATKVTRQTTGWVRLVFTIAFRRPLYRRHQRIASQVGWGRPL